MYLTKKVYIGRNWDNKPAEEMTMKTWNDKEITFDKTKLTELVFDAGYWRKANAIHDWFVKNVQDGEDNCADYYVSKDKIIELLDTVNKVLEASKLVDGKVVNGYSFKDGKKVENLEDGKYIEDSTIAEELLPTTGGFFFGSTNYDQWYYEDLVYTKKILEEALADTMGGDFYYRSSW